jgi:hypothetical protein
MHPELEKRIQMGKLQQSLRLPPETRPSIDRTKLNPLPPSREGAAILQQLHRCPMATLTKQLDQALKQGLDKKDLAEVERLTEGTKACITADIHCTQNLKKRVMVRLTEDEELNAMTQQLAAIACEASTLQETLRQMEQTYNHLEHERFQKAASKYGLNTQEYSYRINEIDETIELIEPNCAECVPVKSLESLLKGPTNAVP